MANTRRTFLQSAALAAGLSGAASSAQSRAAGLGPGQLPGQPPSQDAGPLKSASELEVPKVKFGNVEISRLVLGCNPFYGYAHFNKILGGLMSEWYTQDRVCGVLHQCNRFGINAYNCVTMGRSLQDLEHFQAEGGKMHLIVQGSPGSDPAAIVKAFKPLALYHVGDTVDRAFQTGNLDDIKEWSKKAMDTGVMVGVGTHKPEVIATIEEEGWDVDFYAGCVYNRTRTPDELRKLLGGELPMPRGEVFLEDDPPRMYKVIRQTKKPCFAFKILAAGRIERPEALDLALRTAFGSIKPTDCIFVGMFPKFQDEVRANVERSEESR